MSAKFPKIFVYAVCWNEEKLLPYFFRHYSRFASRITIYDNRSTDRSREIISRQPGAKLRDIDTGNKLDESMLTALRNSCWKEARRHGADYVIVVDIDEFVIFPNIAEDMSALRRLGISILRPTGFEMVSEKFPVTRGQIYSEIRKGVFAPMYCKPCVFDPNMIDDMGFLHGSHEYKPKGEACELFSRNVRLLHCKAIGRFYFLARNRLYRSRWVGKTEPREHGVQYHLDERQQLARFLELKSQAKPVI